MINSIIKDRISVIIPAYNHENFVQHTISSIINQDYQDIELIIIDDGSSDQTLQKIEDMRTLCEQRFSNTIIKTQNNLGICRTLNRLLSQAKGEYIAIIASDDVYKPKALSTLHSFLKNNQDFVFAVGNNEFIDVDGKILYLNQDGKYTLDENKAVFKSFREIYEDRTKYDFTSERFGTYPSFLFGNYIPNGYLICRSAMANIVFTPEAPLEDYFLHFSLSKIGKYKYIDEILFSYRQHPGSASKNTDKMYQMAAKTLAYEKKQALARNDIFSTYIKHYNEMIK